MFVMLSRLLIVTMSVLLVAAAAHAAPQAVEGVLDLTGWDFQRDGIVALDGEWAFFGNALLPPDLLPVAGTAPQPIYVAVPGAWNGAPDVNSQPMGRYGFGTYWLRILLPAAPSTASFPSEKELAIFIPYAHTAYELWVDGQPLAANGVVSRTSAEGKPAFRPEIVRFQPTDGDVDVVVYVSNYHFREGGLPRRLELGTANQIAMKQRRIEIMDGILFGAMVIMATLFGSVYWVRRDRRADGFFSAFLMLVAVRMLVTGDHLLARVTSGIPWQLGLTIEYVTAYVSPAVLLYYLRELFPKDVSPWVVRAWTGYAALGSVASITLPGRLSSELIPAFLVVVAVSIVYGVYVGLRAVRRGRPDSQLFLVGLLASMAATLVTLLRYTGVAPIADLIPLGIVVLVVSQGLLLAVRWARTYQQTMVLAAENARMLETTQTQLKKLRDYRRLMTLREENLRRRIAETLHGRTQGRLFFTVRLIDQAERAMREDVETASGYLKAARNLLHQVREEDIRSTSRRLHPAAVGAGLVPAIESLLDTFDESYDIYFDVDPNVETRDHAEGGGFRYDLRLGVYRIVEEALNNIARHAQASKIQLGLSLVQRDGKEFLELTVADNGVGFDPSRQTNGLGLQTIDARVGDLGGEWKLTGAPGRGATLWVCVPVLPNGPAGRERDEANGGFEAEETAEAWDA